MCASDYASAVGYDLHPESGERLSNLKTMCDYMRNVERVNTEKCLCEDWSVTTIPNLVVSTQGDRDDCTLVRTDDGDKVFQVRGGYNCELHCEQGYTPNPSGGQYLQCLTGFAVATTELQSCDPVSTQDCSPRTVENSDRGDSNPLEGSDPITVTCNAGYGSGVLERQWTCDQSSLLWTGESCDANACYPTQVANSDRSAFENRVEGRVMYPSNVRI